MTFPKPPGGTGPTILTRAQRSALVLLLRGPYCLNARVRRTLMAKRLAYSTGTKCREHGGAFVDITEKGRRALGSRS